MKEVRCVIVGGGHVGLHAAKELGESAKELGRTIRVTLIDKEPNHIRKVLLFRPAVGEERIDLPWTSLLPKHIQFVHGTVTAIGSEEKHVQYLDSSGNEHHLDYDILVLTVGSVVKRPNYDLGGSALTDMNSGIAIREKWQTNIRRAAVDTLHLVAKLSKEDMEEVMNLIDFNLWRGNATYMHILSSKEPFFIIYVKPRSGFVFIY